MTIFAKLKGLIKELGLTDCTLYLLDQTLKRCNPDWGVFHYLFFAQPRYPIKLPARRGKNIVVREIKSNDACIPALPRPKHVIDARFKQGYRCLVAENETQLVGCIWLAMALYIEDEVRCDFTPLPNKQAVWDFDVFVHPDHRLSPVFLKLWDGAYTLMESEGRLWSISRISAYNRSSLASHKRMKAHQAGDAVYLCAFGFQLMFSSVAPRFHLSTNSTSRPALAIAPAEEFKFH